MGGQKPVNRAGWWKRKFVLFQMLATGGRLADICPKADSCHPTNKQGVRAFIDEMCVCVVGGRGLRAERAQSSLTVIVISGLTSITLVVLVQLNL